MRKLNNFVIGATIVAMPIVLGSTAFACATTTKTKTPTTTKPCPPKTTTPVKTPCPPKNVTKTPCPPKKTTPVSTTTTTPTTPTPTPTPVATSLSVTPVVAQPTALVNTGPGSVIGIFASVSIVGAVAHRLFIKKFATR